MFCSAPFSWEDRPGKFTVIIIAVLLSAFLGVRPSASEQEASASRVKAAFLYNFAKFVEWPPGTFAPDRKEINFCIMEQEPMAEAVEALQGKVVQGRRIVVKRCRRVEEVINCQVFFASVADKSLAKIIGALKNYPVLTVTDENDDFTKIGGIINLTIVENKVRFCIAANNAERCGLKISSQLLKLALQVKN